MPDFFEIRDSQSRAKHTILHRYAGAWAGIIGGSPVAKQRLVDLVFIDGFAGAGRYARDADKPAAPGAPPIWGSPIIGLQAIQHAAEEARRRDGRIRVTGIINQEAGTDYQRLVPNLLAAQLGLEVVEVDQISRAEFGRVNVFQGDFRKIVEPLVRWLGDAFVLAFIDPYGPVMDIRSLGQLLGRRRTDGITLFPFHDLALRGGSALKEQDERSPSDKGNVTRATAHFGTEEWISIVERADLVPADRERELVDLYVRQIKRIDPDLLVKTIRLVFSRQDYRAYYLCLTTRNGDGAIRMNDELRKAEIEQEWELWRDREQRAKEREGEQETFFDLMGETRTEKPKPLEQVVAPEMVAGDVIRLCPRGVAMERRAIDAHLADTIYTRREISEALRWLISRGVAVRQPVAGRSSSVFLIKSE